MEFYFPIFPQGSLANSVTTTVWIGVWVVVILNLRLGWVLSGLVVPGYIVPLMLIKPWAAATILVESIITYLLVILVSRIAVNKWNWPPLFGRDRFFLILVISVLVRLTLDVFLIPLVSEWFIARYQVPFDYYNNLHSFGLIVVALIANYLWKPKLINGIFCLSIIIGITYFIVAYILIPYTNYSLSNLNYMYEDLASSMLASPKAYIILLSTAYISSRMNLFYGWEFNGILVPALLALNWHNPSKIASTFAETFIILLLGILVLKLPFFKKITIEGARKILLFFNISFAYKFILGLVMLKFFPDYKVSDYYGFGYLLPALMAVKMHDKQLAMKLTRGSLQTSLTAAIMAAVLGFALSWIPNPWSNSNEIDTKVEQASHKISTTIVKAIQQYKLHSYEASIKSKKDFVFASLGENGQSQFSAAIQELRAFIRYGSLDSIANCRHLLKVSGFDLQQISPNYWIIQDKEYLRGFYLIRADRNTYRAANPLHIQVPSPRKEWMTPEVAFGLWEQYSGNLLSIAGAEKPGKKQSAKNVLKNTNSYFLTFQKANSDHDLVQVRSNRYDIEEENRSSHAYIQGTIPERLNLSDLKAEIGNLKITWGQFPEVNVPADVNKRDYLELRLNKMDRMQLLPKVLMSKHLNQEQDTKNIAGYLQKWLLENRQNIARKDTNTYKAPLEEELLYIDREVLTPLWELINDINNGLTFEDAEKELKALNGSLKIFGYEIFIYTHEITDEKFFVLQEKLNLKNRRYWGTYVFRIEQIAPYLVQIPRPLFGQNVFEFGISLFDFTKASALLIGGCHPFTNQDHSSDIVRQSNRNSLFTLIHQVTLREKGDDPLISLQCRAYAPLVDENPLDTDILIATRSGKMNVNQLNDHEREFIKSLESYNMKTHFADGSYRFSGYQVGNNAQAAYLSQTKNKSFMILWLSSHLRYLYQQQTDSTLYRKQMLALDIESVGVIDLYGWLTSKTVTQKSKTDNEEEFLYWLQQYLQNPDLLILYKLNQLATGEIKFGLEQNSNGLFLLLEKEGQIVIANLLAKFPVKILRYNSHSIHYSDISRFIQQKGGILIVEK